MPAAEDGIYIDHGQALTFVEEMNTRQTQIQQIISTLEGELAPLVTQWLGPDANAYQVVQAAWNSEVTAAASILQQHAQTLEGVSDLYKQTTAQNAQGFEEVQF